MLHLLLLPPPPGWGGPRSPGPPEPPARPLPTSRAIAAVALPGDPGHATATHARIGANRTAVSSTMGSLTVGVWRGDNMA
eukprot:13003645-Alexandrium_andersonii.AAC.1